MTHTNRPFSKGIRVCLVAALSIVATSAVAAIPQVQVSQVVSSPCAFGSYYPSVNSAGTKVVFTSFCDLVAGGNSDGNSELFIVNADGTNIVQLTHTTGGVGIYNPQIAANGSSIVFVSDRDLISGGNADGNGEIFTIRPDGTNLKQLTNTTGGRSELGFPGNSEPCFDPSAAKIAFSSDRDLVSGQNSDGNNDLFMMNADGSSVAQLTSTTGGYGVGSGCLNGADTKVVFDADRDLVGTNSDLNCEIFIANVNGTNLVQVTNTVNANAFGNTFPRWTSNGQTIFFRSDLDLTGNNPDGTNEAFRMQSNGSGMVQLTCSAHGFGSTAWGITPNGKTIAIESDADLVPGNNPNALGQIFVMKLLP